MKPQTKSASLGVSHQETSPFASAAVCLRCDTVGVLVKDVAPEARCCVMLGQACSSKRLSVRSRPGRCCATQLARVFKEFLFAIHVEKQETTDSPEACLPFSPGFVIWTYDANAQPCFIFNFIFELKKRKRIAKLQMTQSDHMKNSIAAPIIIGVYHHQQ